MGYNITIGNAVPEFSKEGGELWAGWYCEVVSLPDAPTFPGDEDTGNSNCRRPSYGAWQAFCKYADIYDVFYDETNTFRGGHPGCVILKRSDLERIREARIKIERASTLPPGFNEYYAVGLEKYDAILARLIWLEWWMNWALTNCETPAIENS